MAIRRPSINSPTWLFQDFLYQETPDGQDRYVQVKWDGAVYERKSSTYDYSNPPYSNSEQRGGSIVAQLDYTVSGTLVTITAWTLNWRDEWPLRLAINYLLNCLYPPEKDYIHRVAGEEVYSQSGDAIPVSSTDPRAFWVSEGFTPISNAPDDYLVYAPIYRSGSSSGSTTSYTALVSPDMAIPGNILSVLLETEGVSLGTPLYWRVSGPGVTPSFFQGSMSGRVEVGR
jgi:hypothetical protein